MGSILMLTVLSTKESGKTTNNMVLGRKSGLMDLSTQVNMLILRRKERANMYGLMVISTLAVGKLMLLMEKESTVGLMAGNIVVSGKTT